MRMLLLIATVMAVVAPCHAQTPDDRTLQREAVVAMKRATKFYRERVASHGGYVYHYSLDLQQRWGEGVATIDQIWVQPPGTPTVGMAFLRAYEQTGDTYYLDAATEAAESLIHGQLHSGGWRNCVDFNPRGTQSASYRNGKGRGKNYSSLDDNQTQSAIRLMMRVDRALQFKHPAIHESATLALDALLAAQFPNGGFPQVWQGPSKRQPVVRARYPDYDWRTEGRIKEYWKMYTLNDNVCGDVADTLIEADAVYDDERYLQAARKLGDFLLLAQMPEPQPAWAQQYNYRMQPIWARRFEPAAISGLESQGAIQTLLTISHVTGDAKYREPIPRALAYLRRSKLDDGQLARYYELKSNKPLYMERHGKQYELTYRDDNLPSHYGWKCKSRLRSLQAKYERLERGEPVERQSRASEAEVRSILAELDSEGRWISTYDGSRLAGQPKMAVGAKYLSSERFSRNLETICDYLSQQ